MVWLMLMLVCVQGTTVAQKVGDTFTADKLKYRVLNEQEVEVVRHIDKNYATGEVIIPETVVAAKWNRNYTVTTIGEVAFAYCSGLRAINIPNSVTTIESEAFCGCSGLTSINIPNSVTTIEYQTFSGCSGLTAINIPNSITTIGNDAFKGCSKLTAITVDTDNANFSSSEGVLFDKSQQILIQYPKGKDGEYNIPNSVTTIGNGAFDGCSGLTAINIPNSVTTVGSYAFSDCSGLTAINIPNSVTTIEYSAFEGCNGLNTINIPNSVTTIGSRAFHGCSGLTTINIPNSVITIGGSAFEDCSRLTTINIPNSVKTIGGSAFEDCSRLTTINIPNSVKTIGSEAFAGCNRLKTLYFHSINPPTVTGDDLGYDFHPETIYVPQEAVATYQTTEPYYRYNIQGMDETAGIGEVETTEAPQSGNIYDLNGRLVRTDGNLQALPKGIYILNVKKMVR